jgi:hypothetical protein
MHPKTRTLQSLVDAVEENNKMHPDQSWSVWPNADEIIYVYGTEDSHGSWENYHDEHVPVEEAKDVLNRAIQSNGSSIETDMKRIYDRTYNLTS